MFVRQDAGAQAQSEWRFSFQICVFPLDVSDLSDWGQQGIVLNPAALIETDFHDRPVRWQDAGVVVPKKPCYAKLRTQGRLTEEVILENRQ